MRRTAGLCQSAEDYIARFLIFLSLALLVTGLLGPYISKLGLGRLPGDIVMERGGTTFYFPLMTSLILSIVLSTVLWMVGR